MDREREILEEEVLSLQAEMQENRDQLSRLTTETYMKQIHSDYRDLFGDEFPEEEQQQQMTITV
jgi:hypothetical protein